MEYVTHEECERHREEIKKTDDKQCNAIVGLQTTSGFLVKGFWLLMGAIITGFVSVVVAVLSLR